MRKVALILGSDSDLAVVTPCADTLKTLGIPFEARVLSAHRTPAAAARCRRSPPRTTRRCGAPCGRASRRPRPDAPRTSTRSTPRG